MSQVFPGHRITAFMERIASRVWRSDCDHHILSYKSRILSRWGVGANKWPMEVQELWDYLTGWSEELRQR